MKEIILSESTSGIVEVKKIIDKIKDIEHKISEGEQEIRALHNQLKSSKTVIEKAGKEKDEEVLFFFRKGISNDELFKLIENSDKSYSTTFKNLGNLITSSNKNILLLSEMINSLAMLSGLSFEKVEESTSQLEELTSILQQSVDNGGELGSQLNKILRSHINKIKEEKNKSQKIEYNFQILNDNFSELESNQQELHSIISALNINVSKNTKELKILTDSQTEKDTFLPAELDRVKKKVNYLLIINLFVIGLIFIGGILLFFTETTNI